jgi:hypothetical protein
MSATARRGCTGSSSIAEGPIIHYLGNLVFQTATGEGFYDGMTERHCQMPVCRQPVPGNDLNPIQPNSEGLGGPACLATRSCLSVARGPDGRAILDRLAQLSRPFGTKLEQARETRMICAA